MREVLHLLSHNPLFGLLLSVGAYAVGTLIYRKTKIMLLNPLLLSIIIICAVLLLFGIDYEAYDAGGQIVTMLLGPATVCLAVPLYDQIPLIKKNVATILVSIALGSVASLVSIFALCKLFHLDRTLMLSLLPKSVTSAIAMGIADDLGGIKAITVMSVVLTGIVGATVGPAFCRLIGIKNRVAAGLAIGTSSHALGTTKALEMGEQEGAMSALAIGVAGIITVAVAPLLLSLLTKIWGY